MPHMSADACEAGSSIEQAEGRDEQNLPPLTTEMPRSKAPAAVFSRAFFVRRGQEEEVGWQRHELGRPQVA